MTNRNSIRSWMSILLLAGLGISAGPHQVLTLTSEVSRALSPALSNYEVIRMEPGEIERQVRTTGEPRFRLRESDFYFNLEPHDMRAPNYRAVEVGPGGARRDLPARPVHTFEGVLAGQEDVHGRFSGNLFRNSHFGRQLIADDLMMDQISGMARSDAPGRDMTASG